MLSKSNVVEIEKRTYLITRVPALQGESLELFLIPVKMFSQNLLSVSGSEVRKFFEDQTKVRIIGFLDGEVFVKSNSNC